MNSCQEVLCGNVYHVSFLPNQLFVVVILMNSVYCLAWIYSNRPSCVVCTAYGCMYGVHKETEISSLVGASYISGCDILCPVVPLSAYMYEKWEIIETPVFEFERRGKHL
jgi:hypothetical protein